MSEEQDTIFWTVPVYFTARIAEPQPETPKSYLAEKSSPQGDPFSGLPAPEVNEHAKLAHELYMTETEASTSVMAEDNQGTYTPYETYPL